MSKVLAGNIIETAVPEVKAAHTLLRFACNPVGLILVSVVLLCLFMPVAWLLKLVFKSNMTYVLLTVFCVIIVYLIWRSCRKIKKYLPI